ncbi:MAG: hypothetical protein ACE5OZ_02140 [Candidatus Heimdallarchaeota archaeon]
MSVHLVVVTNMDGLPLYFFQTDLQLEVDPTLFSGFLTAAASFGQLVRSDLVMTDLSLGELRLHFHHGEKAITVLGTKLEGHENTKKAIAEFKNLQRYQKLAETLGNSFHQLFNKKIDSWDGRVDAFDDFETTIDLILGSETQFMERELLKLLAQFSQGKVSQAKIVEAIWEMIEEPSNPTKKSEKPNESSP